MEEKKVFFGQLNADNNNYTLQNNDLLNAVNTAITVANDSDVGDVKPVAGNKVVGTDNWVGDWKCIGAYNDEKRERIVYFITTESVPARTYLAVYDKKDNYNYLVANLTNFNSGEITYNYNSVIHSMTMEEDLFIWVSEGHPPYKINIERGIKKYLPTYNSTVEPYGDFNSPRDLELGKMPPLFAPLLKTSWTNRGSANGGWEYEEKFRGTGETSNLLGNDSFMFCTRFIYNDGEISVPSPYSIVAQPLSNGDSKSYIEVKYTSLDASSESPFDVDRVELIVKYGNNGTAFIIDSVPPENYLTATYKFYNDYLGAALSDDYMAKDFESVPLESGTIESVKNTLILGDNLEGYDTPTETSLQVTPHHMYEDYPDDLTDILGHDVRWRKYMSNGDLAIRVLETTRIWGYDGDKGGDMMLFFAQAIFTWDDGETWWINPAMYVQNSPTIDSEYRRWEITNSEWKLNRDVYYSSLINVSDALSIPANIPPSIEDVGEFILKGNYYERKQILSSFGYPQLEDIEGEPFYVRKVPIYEDNFPNKKSLVWKSNSKYKFGIQFSDYQKRKSFVIPNGEIKTPSTIFNEYPNRFDENQSDKNVVNFVSWELTNPITEGEIPDWADTYQIVRTKSLSHESFLQFYADKILFYYNPNDDISNEVYDSFDFDNNNSFDYNKAISAGEVGEYKLAFSINWKGFFKGIAIPLKFLNDDGVGYEYVKGDVLHINSQDSSGGFDFVIDSVSGGYILCKTDDVYPKAPWLRFFKGYGASYVTPSFWENIFGSDPSYKIDGADMLIPTYGLYQCEIRRPANADKSKFYEVSQVYPIVESGGQRQYVTTNGKLRGDTYLAKSKVGSYGSFVREKMNRGNLWQKWETDAMRQNLSYDVTGATGQVRKPRAFRWSGNYINGTKINNLNTFNGADEVIVSEEVGDISKLTYTSKISDYGNSLLVIGKKGTVSIYIQENVLTDSQDNESIMATTNFVGTIRELRGEYGTEHPLSVVENNGNVYWFDKHQSSVIRYSQAGLFPISDYKMKSFFKRIADIDYDFVGGIDPYTNEYLLSVPALPNKEYIEYPSDWDGVTVCDDTTPTGYGDGFSAVWGDFTCIKDPITSYSAIWTNYICTKIPLISYTADWGDYTCVTMTTSTGGRDAQVYRTAYWGDYVCVKDPISYSASWLDYLCTVINDRGSYTAVWDKKLCVQE